jgi:hypothetical protein
LCDVTANPSNQHWNSNRGVAVRPPAREEVVLLLAVLGVGILVLPADVVDNEDCNQS